MITLVVFALLASGANLPAIQNTDPANSSITHQALVDVPKGPNRLTLYNEKGEAVARCEKKDGSFQDCKMESGVSLDDLMNAWVHAYLEIQK